MDELANLSFHKTKDGSHTLVNTKLDETYHSRHGAIQEAYHVFIRSALDLLKSKNELSIFEMGFGTGLNAFITYLESLGSGQTINYCGIESTPLPATIWKQLNYLEELNAQNHQTAFESIHACAWNKYQPISPSFHLKKLHNQIENTELEESFDLVYFDAFGPRVQPHLWELAVFKKLFLAMRPHGILVTYSCKGDVKRALLAAGFNVKKIPGPPGKREMLRAIKPNS